MFSSKSLLQCKMEVINRTNSRKFSVIIYNIYIYIYIYIYKEGKGQARGDFTGTKETDEFIPVW